MKVYSAESKRARKGAQQGFTLIEMIGVLAVIAILAAVLIPKVFEAINNARVNNAAMSYNTVKTAIADHYAKFGSIAVDGSGATPVVLTPLPIPQFDQVLVKEQFLDKPFATKIGDGITDATHTRVELVDIGAFKLNDAVGATDATGFNLDGVVGTKNEEVGSVGVVAVITGVTENDAHDLNTRIDGTSATMGVAVGSGLDDTAGRVKYAKPTGGVTDVYIYVTHR
jgi:prepilin-type N-terminal cleavage/methylation domain-containing protein